MPDPLERQLVDKFHVEDLRGRQIPPRTLPRNATDGPIPCVVLADRAWAGEMDAVEWRLARYGVPVVRLDPESSPTRAVTVLLDEGAIDVQGVRIRPTVFWHRDFAAASVPKSDVPESVRALHGAGWGSLVSQLSLLAARVINPQPPLLLSQLLVAAESGVRVPRTVISNDPGSAGRDLGTDRLVVKALSNHWSEPEPGLLCGAFPVALQKSELDPGLGETGPLVIQEYVDHGEELRVYAIGDSCISYRIEKASPEAIWKEPEQVRAALVETPPSIREAVSRLQLAFSLDYGAYDFLMSVDREPVFLEVNTTGAWLWCEEKMSDNRPFAQMLPYWLRVLTGSRPVTKEVSKLIERLHQDALAV